jgi:hypothetical protein
MLLLFPPQPSFFFYFYREREHRFRSHINEQFPNNRTANEASHHPSLPATELVSGFAFFFCLFDIICSDRKDARSFRGAEKKAVQRYLYVRVEAPNKSLD